LCEVREERKQNRESKGKRAIRILSISMIKKKMLDVA
jgi:hypothetical protein